MFVCLFFKKEICETLLIPFRGHLFSMRLKPISQYSHVALNTAWKCPHCGGAVSPKWLSRKAFATQPSWLAKHCSAPGPKFTFLFCFSLSHAKCKGLACLTARFANTITVTHSTALHHNTFFQWDFILDGTIFTI